MRNTARNSNNKLIGDVMTPAEIVAKWGQELLRNMGPDLPTSSYNKLHAAISELKAKLAKQEEK